jgi:hypothetical protein
MEMMDNIAFAEQQDNTPKMLPTIINEALFPAHSNGLQTRNGKSCGFYKELYSEPIALQTFTRKFFTLASTESESSTPYLCAGVVSIGYKPFSERESF